MRKDLVAILIVVGALAAVSVLYAVTRPEPHQQDSETTAIEGYVEDEDGRPVSGATIYARRVDLIKGIEPSANSDKEGRFLIKNLAAGTYTVYGEKEADDYPSTNSAFYSANSTPPVRAEVVEGQVSRGIRVQLGPKAARLVVRTLDATINRPIKNLENVQITLRREDNPNYSYSTGPNTEGEFSIPVPPVPLTIEVSAPGYEPWTYSEEGKARPGSLKLNPGETKRLDIALRRQRPSP